MSASVIPDTLYMRLRAKFKSKNDAQAVADVLQTVYMDDVRRQSTAQYNDSIELLQSQLRDTREEVDTLDRRIENLEMSRAFKAVVTIRTIRADFIEARESITLIKRPNIRQQSCPCLLR